MVAGVGLVAKIKRMDGNPYASPISVAASRDASRPRHAASPYALAGLFGVDTWLGLGVSFVFGWKAWEAQGWLIELPLHLLFCSAGIVAAPFAVAVARWQLRSPASKWPCCVANLVGFTPFVMSLIGVLFFGMK